MNNIFTNKPVKKKHLDQKQINPRNNTNKHEKKAFVLNNKNRRKKGNFCVGGRLRGFLPLYEEQGSKKISTFVLLVCKIESARAAAFE